MALFLRCVQRCFLARRNSQPSPPVPGLRTHRRADATGEMRGDGPGGGANSSALLAEVLLARTPGSGSALPAAGPAPPGCPGKDSTSGTELSAGQLPRLKHHCLTPAAAAAPLHAPAAPKPPPQSPDRTHARARVVISTAVHHGLSVLMPVSTARAGTGSLLLTHATLEPRRALRHSTNTNEYGLNKRAEG